MSRRPLGDSGWAETRPGLGLPLEEVELTANLIVAASETDERLPRHRIDEISGVPRTSHDPATSSTP